MSSSIKYKEMAEERGTKTEADLESKAVLEKMEDSLVIVDDKLLEYEYGAPEPVCHPSNYNDRLLLATACCCCCGLRAMKYSLEVNYKLRAGDIEGAKKASDKALHYSNISVLTGIIIFGIIAVLFLSVLLLLLFVAIDAARGFHP